ncbi:MAG: amidase [bacterium]|nr:amidase [bacterium]
MAESLPRGPSRHLVGMGPPAPTGRQIARQVRSGGISARTATDRALAALHDRQAELNITTYIDEQAAGRAAELDTRVAAGEDPGPLCGVPVVIKDLINQAGIPNTCGSAFYRIVPQHSAPVVRRLEEAGAVIVGRAGLHEFAFGFSSENQWFGPVRNPHDPTTSPGGSSGGSAAAVAAGLVPISIGTDTGGSIRVPAAMCGILGLKVTHGRIPLTGVFPLGPSLDTVGPFAANTADLALAYTSLAGWHPEDSWSAPRSVGAHPLELPMSPAEVRLGLPSQWLAGAPYLPGMEQRFHAIVNQLEALGFGVDYLDDPVISAPGRINEILYPQVAAGHRKWWEAGKPYGAEVADRIRETLTIGGALPSDSLLGAQAWQALLRNRMAAAFQRFDLLVVPTAGGLRKVIGNQEMETNQGRLLYRLGLSWFSALVNTSGCPAISVPVPDSGQTTGVPFSLQLVAPWWKEDLLLRTAAALEREGIVRSILATGT